MSESLRIGVLGAANILSDLMLKPQASGVRFRFIAIASRDPRRANELTQFSKIHESYESLIADPEVDAVFVLLPNALHLELVRLALLSGKHVFCEKPLCCNAVEARVLAKLAAAHPRQVAFEGFHWLFHPQARRVREVLYSGRVGKIREWHLSFCHLPMYPEGNIRWSYELGGGCFMDIGCYLVSALRFFSGQEPCGVISAQADVCKYHHLVDKSMGTTLALPDGTTATLQCSFEAPEFSMKLVAIGSTGRVDVINFLSGNSSLTVCEHGKEAVVERPGGEHRKTPTYVFQAQAFLDRCSEPQQAHQQGTFNDAVLNMEVVDAVYEASGLGARRSRVPVESSLEFPYSPGAPRSCTGSKRTRFISRPCARMFTRRFTCIPLAPHSSRNDAVAVDIHFVKILPSCIGSRRRRNRSSRLTRLTFEAAAARTAADVIRCNAQILNRSSVLLLLHCRQ